ncbi:MAG: GPR1/FUN34/YaaH family transporter, partial [Acidimicrobiales bacterium]
MADSRQMPNIAAQVPAIADPGPLGLAGFALTTFVLSAHNAGWAPDIVWIGLA